MAFPSVTESVPSAPESAQSVQSVPDDIFNSAVFGSGEVIEDPFAALPASGMEQPQYPAYPQAPATAQVAPNQTPVLPPQGQPQAPAAQPAQPVTLPPEIQAQLDQARQILPLARFIQENPDIAEAIERKLNGTVPQASPAAPAPVAPVVPARPASYNAADAVQNPESESWKYREAYEKYQADTIEFVRGELARRDERDQQAQRQAQAQQAQQVRMRQVASEVMAQHGLSQEQAVDFVRTMSDPRSVNVANLVQLYRIQRGLPITAAPRIPQGSVPPPPIAGGGVPVPATTITEGWFDDAARAWVKKSGQ